MGPSRRPRDQPSPAAWFCWRPDLVRQRLIERSRRATRRASFASTRPGRALRRMRVRGVALFARSTAWGPPGYGHRQWVRVARRIGAAGLPRTAGSSGSGPRLHAGAARSCDGGGATRTPRDPRRPARILPDVVKSPTFHGEDQRQPDRHDSRSGTTPRGFSARFGTPAEFRQSRRCRDQERTPSSRAGSAAGARSLAAEIPKPPVCPDAASGAIPRPCFPRSARRQGHTWRLGISGCDVSALPAALPRPTCSAVRGFYHTCTWWYRVACRSALENRSWRQFCAGDHGVGMAMIRPYGFGDSPRSGGFARRRGSRDVARAAAVAMIVRRGGHQRSQSRSNPPCAAGTRRAETTSSR